MARLWSQLAPRRQAREIAAVAVDAVRSRRELVLENAVLCHRVNVLRRRRKRPTLHLIDRSIWIVPRPACKGWSTLVAALTRCLDSKLHIVRERVHRRGMTPADTERILAPRRFTAAQRLAGDQLAALRELIRDVALMLEVNTALPLGRRPPAGRARDTARGHRGRVRSGSRWGQQGPALGADVRRDL